jgi:hypothetical protein
MDTWERKNPDWAFRCLDATTIERYVPLRQYVDLDRQSITAASLSDIVRILLLHEFGGVWVDATVLCNRPLDEWLPDVMGEEFFAFADPAPDRPLSSWFLSSESGNYLLSAWCRRTIDYWSNRASSDDYFWFHHLFREACATERRAGEAWSRVPKVSAAGPHALQAEGFLFRPATEVIPLIDLATPVFKLTHRLPEEASKPGGILAFLLTGYDDENGEQEGTPQLIQATPGVEAPKSFASLSVSTENLGDHIQIIAGLRLLAGLGVTPTRFVDRDNEIRSVPTLDDLDGPVGILLNGWFKTNREEWPPHPKLAPIIDGLHIRPFQCTELVSDESIAFFRSHEPIGCRDVYTRDLLRSKGVETFISNCLSLTLPRRLDDAAAQTEVFVASRDERIRDYLPKSIGPYAFVSHYSGSTDFAANVTLAKALLQTYRSRAKLIITTLLHCALPAIAMGIPVVVFYPMNDESAHASDLERFSGLDGLVRVHAFEEIDSVDWNPKPIDIGTTKRESLDRFYELTARWQLAPRPALGPIAPPSLLPAP